MSSDPYEAKLCGHSPYNFAFNNPIVNNDPDGKTGEARIVGNKVIISQNLYFYGTKMTRKTAREIARRIQDSYNAANGYVTIDGKKYKVEFNIKGYAISKEDAMKMIRNAGQKDNFIAVGESNPEVNKSHTDGNAGWWNTKQDEKTGGTTYSHEEIHGFGQTGHPDLYEGGNVKDPSTVTDAEGNIAIRIPSDAKIDGRDIDATKRTVQQSDIDALHIEEAIKNMGGNLGKINQQQFIYNDDGTIYADKFGIIPSAEDFFKEKEKTKKSQKIENH